MNNIGTPKEIVKYPDPVLTTPCREVAPDEMPIARQVVADLVATIMQVKWGKPVGLAANQIGHNLRIFIALGEAFVNPRIVWETKAPKTQSKEGCYSLEENKDFIVPRTPSLTLEWVDLDGNGQTKRFNGLHAIVVQHELDHLNGKLCNDHADA